MSVKAGQKLTKRNKRQSDPIPFEFTERQCDGRYVLWQHRYVKGYSYSRNNPVWVIAGVYKKIPQWAQDIIAKQKGAAVTS